VKIRIPLLLLGPYLRPFLKVSALISGALSVILFVASCRAKSPVNRVTLEDACFTFFTFFIFFVAIFVFFWVLGMP
jgi:hypothetical protein